MAFFGFGKKDDKAAPPPPPPPPTPAVPPPPPPVAPPPPTLGQHINDVPTSAPSSGSSDFSGWGDMSFGMGSMGAPSAGAAPSMGMATEASPPPPPKVEVPTKQLVIEGHYNLDQLLRFLVDNKGSDLHLSVGMPPAFRIDGHLHYAKAAILTEEHALEMFLPPLDARQKKEFEETGNADLAYAIPEVARFRCNILRQFRGAGAVFRQIPEKMPSLEALGFPLHVMEKISKLRSGLVVVTGPTGSGKSTTLAAIINELNQSRDAHIITIEDPLEFTHKSARCLVDHREVGRDAVSFADAARASLREDPDILLLGEMRDLDTIYNAIKAAETGTLVFGTLHTNSAAKTVDRIIDAFPADQQPQIRSMLSQSLKVIVAQTLLKRKDGPGRVAAYEIMLVTRGIANLLRTGETTQLTNLLLTGTSEGMQPLDMALMKLLDAGVVSEELVGDVCNNPDYFRQAGYKIN